MKLAQIVLVPIFCAFAILSHAAPTAGAAPSKNCELAVYTYDSIAAQGGLGPELFSKFEKISGCKIKVLVSGDGVQLLSHLEIDEKRGKHPGQIVLGIDQALWKRALPFLEPLAGWSPEGSDHFDKTITQEALVQGFVPYNYGVLSLMADQEGITHRNFPHSVQDLLKPEWKKKVILEDPRTSTPGLQFVLMTEQVLQNGFQKFWSSMKNQWLAMPEGWNAAYGLFMKGEAPLVWSYTTSQAYHEEHGSFRYKAVLFDEGQPVQIESAMMVKGSFESRAEKRLAEKFLDLLVSQSIQSSIPKTNWMFPVRDDVRLPESFKHLPKPRKLIFLKSLKTSNTGAILKEWERALHE